MVTFTAETGAAGCHKNGDGGMNNFLAEPSITQMLVKGSHWLKKTFTFRSAKNLY